MEFIIKSGDPEKQRATCIVVGIFKSGNLSKTATAIDTASKKYLSNILKRGDIDAAIGQSFLLYDVPGILPKSVLLLGCGEEKNLSSRHYHQIVSHSIDRLKLTAAKDVIFCLTELNVIANKNDVEGIADEYWKIRQFVELSHSRLYEFNQLKSRKISPRNALQKLLLTVAERKDMARAKKAVTHGCAIAKGITLTRNLANLPPNICNPSYLAEQAKELGNKEKSIKVNVLSEVTMKRLGMNSLLSVAQGSRQPARLITMEYKGGRKDQKPVVLIGKGVTFDTGGISIKPSAAMDEMKYDMCGAASVFGTITAISTMQLPINVVGIVPAVENMPGGQATRPGDIYKSMSKQTIEVLNTDAEGRLILCDALTYSKRFSPAVVIDIATLTGACVIALGRHASGLMSNYEPLAKDIIHAGEKSTDRVWQLPLWDEYQSQLDSPFADMANIGGRDAGTITAACFLSRFAKQFHWAHLDIAGTAWLSGKNKGATGRPVSLLVQYLLDRC